jgi:hypothetical protein
MIGAARENAMPKKYVKPDITRLAAECAKLDPVYEQSLAEEGMSVDIQSWPEYEEMELNLANINEKTGSSFGS